MAASVSALYFYPVKSCRGTELAEAVIDKRGIRHDRSYLLITDSGMAITQREYPRLALVKPELIDKNSLRFSAPQMSELSIRRLSHASKRECQVWNDKCSAIDQGDEAAAWFASIIGAPCRLVTMDDDFVRPVDPDFATGPQQLGFADGFPFLLISEESLADLNSKLEFPLPMNRFRPNIVIRGCEPFAEDSWKRINIGELIFDVVKSCARCVMTTIDQDDAVVGREPLRTLAAYRKFDNQLLFGQNLVHHSVGTIRVGDNLEILDCIE